MHSIPPQAAQLWPVCGGESSSPAVAQLWPPTAAVHATASCRGVCCHCTRLSAPGRCAARRARLFVTAACLQHAAAGASDMSARLAGLLPAGSGWPHAMLPTHCCRKHARSTVVDMAASSCSGSAPRQQLAASSSLPSRTRGCRQPRVTSTANARARVCRKEHRLTRNGAAMQTGRSLTCPAWHAASAGWARPTGQHLEAAAAAPKLRAVPGAVPEAERCADAGGYDVGRFCLAYIITMWAFAGPRGAATARAFPNLNRSICSYWTRVVLPGLVLARAD